MRLRPSDSNCVLRSLLLSDYVVKLRFIMEFAVINPQLLAWRHYWNLSHVQHSELCYSDELTKAEISNS